MAEFSTKCPHCSEELIAEEDWIGMEVECPTCKQMFSVTKNTPKPPQVSLPQRKNITSPFQPREEETAPSSFVFCCSECGTQVELPIALKGQKYECKACCEESVAEPATEKKCPHCGQMIKFHATICKHCKKHVGVTANGSINLQPITPALNSSPSLQPIYPLNNRSAGQRNQLPAQNNGAILQPAYTAQFIGGIFMLQPGEFLLSEGRMQCYIFPARITYMRLTNQRLVFSHISRWLTCVSWIFWYLSPQKISQSFTKSDIRSIEMGYVLFRKILKITTQNGETFGFCAFGFSGKRLYDIMNWWQK